MNNRKKVELRISSLSNSQTQAGVYVLQLSEVGTRHNLTVAIGTSEAQAIMLELRGIMPPRPLTHILFASVLEALGVRLLRVIIYRAEKGIFYSYLYLRSGEMILRVDSRTSDAVALALHMKAPILTYEDLLGTECMTGDNAENLPGDFPPGNDRFVNPDTLKEALQKAIDQEDYEQAAILRDQINHLKEPNS